MREECSLLIFVIFVFILLMPCPFVMLFPQTSPSTHTTSPSYLTLCFAPTLTFFSPVVQIIFDVFAPSLVS